MTVPRSQSQPHDPQKLPPARRRRARRALLPLDAAEKEAFWNDSARRARPSVDFFLFLALGTLVWALGLSVDSPALLLLGAVLAPLMTPVVGLGLGVATGAARYFGQVLGGVVLGSLLAFGLGALGGVAGLVWMPLHLQQASLHTHLTPWDFLVLAIAAVWATIALVRKPRIVLVPGVALAYEIFLPLTAAGFGLGSGAPGLFPNGLTVFAVHLSWAVLFAALGFAILGFRPLSLFGYTLSGMAALVSGLVLVLAVGLGAALRTSLPFTTQPDTPPTSASVQTSPAPPTATPQPPTVTPTPMPTLTLSPSPTTTPTTTPLPSPSPTATPAFAVVAAPAQYGGVLIRSGPGFNNKVIGRANNGERLELLGGEQEADKYIWVEVLIPGSDERGWVLQHLLVIATPQPGW